MERSPAAALSITANIEVSGLKAWRLSSPITVDVTTSIKKHMKTVIQISLLGFKVAIAITDIMIPTAFPPIVRMVKDMDARSFQSVFIIPLMS
jgi:hypothetical protein